MSKIPYDDGSYSYLAEGVYTDGEDNMPMFYSYNYTEIPTSVISYKDLRQTQNSRQFITFDGCSFEQIIRSTKEDLDLVKLFDGVISPNFLDPQMPIAIQKRCAYMSRAIAVFFRKHRMYVIPNISWSTEESYKFCFVGIEPMIAISINTPPKFKTKDEHDQYFLGFKQMLKIIRPEFIVVLGSKNKFKIITELGAGFNKDDLYL